MKHDLELWFEIEKDTKRLYLMFIVLFIEYIRTHSCLNFFLQESLSIYPIISTKNN